MPFLMRFLVSYTNWPNWFSFRILHGLDLPPRILVGKAIALLRVGYAANGDHISTDTYLERVNPNEQGRPNRLRAG
jgi:hypothetical protein